MSLIVFNRNRILYESLDGGDGVAIFMPSKDLVRTYTDMDNFSNNLVAERYGVHDQKPLWEETDGRVKVYGSLLQELEERRNALRVHLPEHFVSADTDSFYFIIGKRWVVLGVQSFNDDANIAEWGVSALDASQKSPVKLVVSSISERMLEAGEESICVAVHDNVGAFEELKRELSPLGVKVIPFSVLKPEKNVKPLYRHRDFSVLMMTFGLFAFLVLSASVAYWAFNYLNLEKITEKVESERRQIREIQVNEQLGSIIRPQLMLAHIRKPFRNQPSAIINAAADVATGFGTLRKLTFDTSSLQTRVLRREEQRSDDVLVPAGTTRFEVKFAKVQLEIDNAQNDLLVDQESLAKSLLKRAPWVREVESYESGGNRMLLEVELQVGE